MHIRAEEIIDAKVKVSDITGPFVEKFFRNGDDEKQAGNAFEHSHLPLTRTPARSSSEKGIAASKCGLIVSLPALSM